MPKKSTTSARKGSCNIALFLPWTVPCHGATETLAASCFCIFKSGLGLQKISYLPPFRRSIWVSVAERFGERRADTDRKRSMALPALPLQLELVRSRADMEARAIHVSPDSCLSL